jgi:hypothetical protein
MDAFGGGDVQGNTEYFFEGFAEFDFTLDPFTFMLVGAYKHDITNSGNNSIMVGLDVPIAVADIEGLTIVPALHYFNDLDNNGADAKDQQIVTGVALIYAF